MDKIILTEDVRCGEVLQSVKEERNIVQTIKRRKVNWIGHILRTRFLLKNVIARKIEVTGRRLRRRKQIFNNLKEKRSYWKLKEETLNRTL